MPSFLCLLNRSSKINIGMAVVDGIIKVPKC